MGGFSGEKERRWREGGGKSRQKRKAVIERRWRVSKKKVRKRRWGNLNFFCQIGFLFVFVCMVSAWTKHRRSASRNCRSNSSTQWQTTLSLLPRSRFRSAPLRRPSSSQHITAGKSTSESRGDRVRQLRDAAVRAATDGLPLPCVPVADSDVVVGVTVQQLAQQLAKLDADTRAAFSQPATAAPVVHAARPLVARPRSRRSRRCRRCCCRRCRRRR